MKTKLYFRAHDTNSFIEKAKIIHNNYYDYSLVEYSGFKKKVNIVCPKHGVFSQTSIKHLTGSGCRKCVHDKCREIYTLTQEQFLERAKEKHGERYDYSKSNYKACNKKIIIICPLHGEFTQLANGHLRGAGCRICALMQSEFFRYKVLPEEALKVPCRLYVLRLYSNNETFYKIGISKNIYKRLKTLEKFYSVELLKLFHLDLFRAVTIEQTVLEKYKKERYKPLIRFDGHTECLNISPIKDIHNFYKALTGEKLEV